MRRNTFTHQQDHRSQSVAPNSGLMTASSALDLAQQGQKLLVSKKEAAKAISCSVRTIENLIVQKKLPSCRVGRRRMIRWRALVEFARRGTPVITGGDHASRRNGDSDE